MISFITPTRDPRPANLERMRRMFPPGSEWVVSTVPGGAAHAKNVGAAVASGDVFVFVDDDVDLWTQWNWDDWLARDWQFAIASVYWPASPANRFLVRAQSTMLNVLTCVFRYKMFMTGFAAVRRSAFEAVGGYNPSVLFEEHAITMDFYRHHFKGARLPVRVRLLRPWHGFGPKNDVTSRGQEHPEPGPGEVRVYRL